MKKIIVLAALILAGLIGMAQEAVPPTNVSVKWAPTGLILGSLSLQGEYNFGGKNSLTAKIGLPVNTKHTLEYDGNDAQFDMKATSFLAGYRRYLSKKHMRGLYLEPYFKYVHHTSEGVGSGTLDSRRVDLNFTNDYDGFGVGAQLGAQFLIGKRFVIDLFFLGPEINAATNNFKTVEVSSVIPWSEADENQAKNDIEDFIDQIPFLKDHTTVTVNRAEKTVRADFKGALPGFRAGVSFGIAF